MIAFPTPAPLRVCFVCNEYPPAMHGGIGSLVQMLARALVASGHQARVIGTQSLNCPAPQYEEDHGVKVWRLRESSWSHSWPLSRYRLYQCVARWARSAQIDLVEVPDFGGPAAWWPNLPVPVISRLHGSTTYFAAELDRKLRRQDFWLERASHRRADYVCSISQYAAKRSQEVFADPGRPIEVLHDFVDAQFSAESTIRRKAMVVFSGTLTRKKGVIELFQAWRQVADKNQHAELHIYGKDGKTEDGKSMKETLIALLDPTIRHTVRFHGHTSRDELAGALSRARVGVFPSYSETFGLGPVESMAAGCPTIYGRCGCADEILRHGIDGLLVDPDKPTEIADAILSLLNDDSLAQRFGLAGRRRVQEKFSLETMLYKNEDYYRQCVEAFADRAGQPQQVARAEQRLTELSRRDSLDRLRRRQCRAVPEMSVFHPPSKV